MISPEESANWVPAFAGMTRGCGLDQLCHSRAGGNLERQNGPNKIRIQNIQQRYLRQSGLFQRPESRRIRLERHARFQYPRLDQEILHSNLKVSTRFDLRFPLILANVGTPFPPEGQRKLCQSPKCGKLPSHRHRHQFFQSFVSSARNHCPVIDSYIPTLVPPNSSIH